MNKSQMIDNVLEIAKNHALVDIYVIDNDGNVLQCEDGFIAISPSFRNRFYIFERCFKVAGGFEFGGKSRYFKSLQLQFVTVWKVNGEIIDAKIFLKEK